MPRPSRPPRSETPPAAAKPDARAAGKAKRAARRKKATDATALARADLRNAKAGCHACRAKQRHPFRRGATSA